MPKQRRSVVLVVVVVGWPSPPSSASVRSPRATSPEKISLDRYTRELAAGNVATATLHDKDHTVTGKLPDGTEYTVNFP